MKSARRCTLGFRAHSGWAAVVVIAGTAQAPEVIFRRRIVIADPDVAGSKQPFHAAEPLEFSEAKAYIDHCAACTRHLARQAIHSLAEELQAKNYAAAGTGILLGSGRPLPELKSVLASHALIHTAEGEFFRNALVEASGYCKLPVTGVKERELCGHAAAELRMSSDELWGAIAALGKSVGPPWAQDQKFAALAGWLALAKQPAAHR